VALACNTIPNDGGGITQLPAATTTTVASHRATSADHRSQAEQRLRDVQRMANCAERLITILGGNRPPRIVNPQVWPAYAKRFEQTFGFSARGVVGPHWPPSFSSSLKLSETVRKMSTWEPCALSDARAGIKIIKQHDCFVLLPIQAVRPRFCLVERPK
jgi:hypothetical protein